MTTSKRLHTRSARKNQFWSRVKQINIYRLFHCVVSNRCHDTCHKCTYTGWCLAGLDGGMGEGIDGMCDAYGRWSPVTFVCVRACVTNDVEEIQTNNTLSCSQSHLS